MEQVQDFFRSVTVLGIPLFTPSLAVPVIILSLILREFISHLIVVKIAEIFLLMSAAALLGLLGGMGLTPGLVFKDIIANWFGCAVIYADNLFRESDWVIGQFGK